MKIFYLFSLKRNEKNFFIRLINYRSMSMDQKNLKSNRIFYGNQMKSWALTGEKPTIFNQFHEQFNSIHEINIEIENLNLIGAQILFRHGARTPLKILPKLEEVSNRIKLIDVFFFILI